jgi:predicted RNA-binding protein
MCQMNIMLDRAGDQELVMENVTLLEVKDGGVEISTLFDAPQQIRDVVVTTIDFTNGKVILSPTN